MRLKSKVMVYTDGSSRRNPGPGGYGAVLLFTDTKGEVHQLELSQGYERTTNNRMELMGPIAALEALKRPCEVVITTDSRYVVDAFQKHWIDGWKRNGWRTSGKEPVKNEDLWRRLIAAIAPHDVSWVWVKGHAGHRYNERCDELATTAADSGGRLVDEGCPK